MLGFAAAAAGDGYAEGSVAVAEPPHVAYWKTCPGPSGLEEVIQLHPPHLLPLVGWTRSGCSRRSVKGHVG
jgi:hypothetical protein